MRLLMTTQVVDSDHPIQGFSHTWIRKLAQRIEGLHVVCLTVGKHDLPSNVRIYPIKASADASRASKFLRFQRYVAPLLLSRAVDGVFVQQTEINAILASPYAMLMHTPVVLFKAHGRSLRASLRLATSLASAVLTSEASAFPIDTPKKVVVGQGIDLDQFIPHERVFSEPRSRVVVAVGRYSQIKGYEVMIEACDILVNQRGIKDLVFRIYGADNYPGYENYRQKLEQMVRSRNLQGRFELHGPVPFSSVSALYSEADLIVHPSDTLSIDKVVLEAMASERVILCSTAPFRSVLGAYSDDLMFAKGNPIDLAKKIEKVLSLPYHQYATIAKELREIVRQGHSVDNLADQIVKLFESLRFGARRQ